MSALATYTAVHVIISLIGIVSGVVVAAGLLTSKRLDQWTQLFLSTTALTSMTGFGFPVDHVLPSHVVGALSLLVLAIAVFARYGRRMAGAWRWVYAVTAMIAFYFNVFVLVVQLFQKVPALKALAPTQSEPPFAIVQLVVLAVFVTLTFKASIRFRPDLTSTAPARS